MSVEKFSPHALSDTDLDSLAAEFGPDIANLVDAATHGTHGTSALEFAADQILALIVSGRSSLIQRVLELGLRRGPEEIRTLRTLQKLMALAQIGAATFPDLGPGEIIETLINRLVRAGVPFSATASETRRH
tara:strand:- start:283 stop:678 length:396 start_codon:yes stop_codon:yes gene_type:complete